MKRRGRKQRGRLWPFYSAACRRDVDALLRRGGGLTAYRSNPNYPVGPREGSWAWKLERRAEALFHVSHAIACNSGTMALMAALAGVNLPKGEIITSPYTFSATTTAILAMGYQAVFADVDEWGLLDPEAVELQLGSKTVGILPVDLFGRAANYRCLCRLHLPIIQDACQAVGGWYAGTRATTATGRQGFAAAYSFNGEKNVPAGEAGMVVTDDPNVADRARLYISHGENFTPPTGTIGSLFWGLNGRLNELTACVAYHGLDAVLKRNAQRQDLLATLRSATAGLPLALPDANAGHALYVCPLLLNHGIDRAGFIDRLAQMGVLVGEGYVNPPLHYYPAFRGAQRGPLPQVEELATKRMVILSQVRPPATRADMVNLGECIRKAIMGRVVRPHRRQPAQKPAEDF